MGLGTDLFCPSDYPEVNKLFDVYLHGLQSSCSCSVFHTRSSKNCNPVTGSGHGKQHLYLCLFVCLCATSILYIYVYILVLKLYIP